MFDKLEALEERFQLVSEKISDPELSPTKSHGVNTVRNIRTLHRLLISTEN